MSKTLFSLIILFTLNACQNTTSLFGSSEEFDNLNGSTEIRYRVDSTDAAEDDKVEYAARYTPSTQRAECIRPGDTWEMILQELVLNQHFDGKAEAATDGNKLNEPSLKLTYKYGSPSSQPKTVTKTPSHGISAGNTINSQGEVLIYMTPTVYSANQDIRQGDLFINIQLFELDDHAIDTIKETKEAVEDVLKSEAVNGTLQLVSGANIPTIVSTLPGKVIDSLATKLARNDILADHRITLVQCDTVLNPDRNGELYLIEGVYTIARVPPQYKIQKEWTNDTDLSVFSYATFRIRKRTAFPSQTTGN